MDLNHEVSAALYLACGFLMTFFYLVQILHCVHDNSKLAGYSMSKSSMQFLLRTAMLPFVIVVGSKVIMVIMVSDAIARGIEFLAAVKSLRRQEVGWGEIRARIMANPFKPPANTVKAAAESKEVDPPLSEAVVTMDSPEMAAGEVAVTSGALERATNEARVAQAA